MNISFTGINNVNICHNSKQASYSYITPSGEQRVAPGKNTEIDLTCLLSDDENGNDLRNFYDAMYKSHFPCSDNTNPYLLNLKANLTQMVDKDCKCYFIDVNINGCDIDLKHKSDRNLLPLYTFVAKITSKLKQDKTRTPYERECADAMNQYIHKKAVHFIENTMTKN